MTTQIYVQTTEVFTPITYHMGIWIVKDGVTTILNAFSSASFGIPVSDPINEEYGNIVIEKIVSPSVPNYSAIEELNLNLLDLTSQEADIAASKMLSYYNTLGLEFQHDGRTFIRPVAKVA